MEYNFRDIEKKWQKYWSENNVFKAENTSAKPKYYVLDMFPYPSGAGLHVGHPLGYIASDIYSRYKRHTGFNVLHPMGYDAYGLPAEQYAIQTGTHPATTTEKNINRYRMQLDKLGLSFDWDREVRTCDPKYYKWTQWVFIRLFHSWYDNNMQKAQPITSLIASFEKNGNAGVNAACNEHTTFSADKWNSMTEKEQQAVLMNYRLAYLADTMVNWCPALGTVLANDEVSEGSSIRGGHPVVRKTMKQWSLRITAYADRLLQGLNEIDWFDSLKEIQRNWIGKSEGSMLHFPVKGHDLTITVFTTRPDTIFGVTYMTLAPEHEYVQMITTPAQREAVNTYVEETANRSERERMADVKRISGVFTGAYAVNPFTGKDTPIWIGDYVLSGYGTGAVMAVPGHDSRDHAFAKHFGLPVKEVISGGNIEKEAYESKEGVVVNSGFINGMKAKDAISVVIRKAEENGAGYSKINFRLRDAIFSRQRYWGEPFPVYYKGGIPYTLDESELPLPLPEVDAYMPTETGEPPLARAKSWHTLEGYPLETSTMPGFAGSSAYYLRYMDPWNENELVSIQANLYWENVDLYIGGAEHATGHLLYSRFWNKFLYDIGIACKDEPFKKLINQGMIQGRSNLIYQVKGKNAFISKGRINSIPTEDELKMIHPSFNSTIAKKFDPVIAENAIPLDLDSSNWGNLTTINIDINLADNDILKVDEFIRWRKEYSDAIFIKEEDGNFICEHATEKMSKSLYNVQNPDELIEKYGADTLRMYEMFLGPIEQHKPWDTKGIEGVFRFLRKFWRLFFEKDELCISDELLTDNELKVLHKTIKKVREDIERFSFNTAVSNFMICVNDLTDLKCNKRGILEPLTILLSPYASHMAEELWQLLGHNESIEYVSYPNYEEKYLAESVFEYPVSFNGKMRFKLLLPLNLSISEIEKEVLSSGDSQKWLAGKPPKKVIVVQGKIINVVI